MESLLLNDRPDENTVVLEMVCGKGGYVRSIARDLGRALGCLGHVQSLHRTWSGPFDLENAITWDQIEDLAKDPALDDFILPIEAGLADVPHGTTNAEGAAKIRNGNPGICFTDAEYGDEIWVSHQGQAVAIGRFKSGELHPSRVLNT